MGPYVPYTLSIDFIATNARPNELVEVRTYCPHVGVSSDLPHSFRSSENWTSLNEVSGEGDKIALWTTVEDLIDFAHSF